MSILNILDKIKAKGEKDKPKKRYINMRVCTCTCTRTRAHVTYILQHIDIIKGKDPLSRARIPLNSDFCFSAAFLGKPASFV